MAAFANMNYDVVEFRAGTYNTGLMEINVDRTTRPLVVRPAIGAQPVFTNSQFWFGRGGVSAFLDFEFTGVTFDRNALGDTGIVWMGNVHDMKFNGPTVTNASCIGSGSIYSWALYLSIDNNVSPRNVVADDWVIRGVNRATSALQVGHPPSVMSNITTRRWTVDSVAIAIYAYGTVGGYTVSDWTVTNSVRPDRPYTVFFGSTVTGSYSNLHVNSGLESQGGMTDGGGNVWNQ